MFHPMLQVCYASFFFGQVAYLIALTKMGTMVAAISADVGHGAMLSTICLLLFRQAYIQTTSSDRLS